MIVFMFTDSGRLPFHLGSDVAKAVTKTPYMYLSSDVAKAETTNSLHVPILFDTLSTQ